MTGEQCTSCRGQLAETGATSFKCPVCSGWIRRCYRCREQSVPYICPSCGFRGP
ncbi:MAG: DUF1610 domain-containing protein [Methanomicrobiaceae archaeon]|nr:DUF1610 domain-containing protein [Methanomicrobiaceae archaeon]MDD5420287.1 zinc finger domain-containing protein [Methanomicrobiaceae archaeon]